MEKKAVVLEKESWSIAGVGTRNEVNSTTDELNKCMETSSRTRDNSAEGERGYGRCSWGTGQWELKVALLG
ncbi:hypothetical protein TNCV_3412381 [Trichonephila clavipes]|uniref:Uncharacterized protein n=1 Tax=Trichonephila clavipes TaxID=2585209 RepID=A0A8X6RFU9_TRICX|nr:hypothetical protein TNCV_3412381 [Trichonephila clavipes]